MHDISTMEIKTFNQNRIRENPDLDKQYQMAIDLLGKWRANKISFSEALDIEKWGLFYALSDLFGAPHAVSTTNLRFYYNPITKLLEPVGFDAQAGNKLIELGGITKINRHKGFSLHEKYLAALEKISDPAYVKGLFKKLRGPLDKIKTEAQLNFQEPIIEENAQIIRNLINPAKGLRAYFYEQSAGNLVLQMSNFLRFPIQVESITLSGRALIDPQNLPLIPPKGYTGISLKSYRIKLPPDLKWSDSMKNSLEVNYRMLGSTRLNKDKVLLSNFPDADRLTRIFESDLSNYKAFDFLVADHHAKQIIFAPGKWIIGKNLIIPKGFTVFCGPGTKLDMENGANIISFSPMHFMGNVDDPILIHSSDSTGQGFILSGAKSPSYFKHVKFENLMSPHKDLWENQGAITAYDSDVTFLNSYFTGNRGQTGLMVLQSTFQIIKTAFEKNKFDALTVELKSN